MPASPELGAEIRALIEREGPIPLTRFMALANAQYYATRDPFGAGGDFVTAPEVSQMFGELIGLALADVWQRAERPSVAYVELGPGRGTLAVDALRAMAKAGLTPPVHFVETSPLLKDQQAARLPAATWHETIESLPADCPLLIVANEFFDALPVRQLISTVTGWRERMVTIGPDDEFLLEPGRTLMDSLIPGHLLDAEPGGIVEQNPDALVVMRALAERLARQGGALLAIDYGHDGSRHGDTLQAIRAHAYADPLAKPGESDLTAHVDFLALEAAARAGGAEVAGPIEQGQWLVALGIADRAAALARGAPARGEEIAEAYRRLTHSDEMGRLFKVLAATAPEWPEVAGFA